MLSVSSLVSLGAAFTSGLVFLAGCSQPPQVSGSTGNAVEDALLGVSDGSADAAEFEEFSERWLLRLIASQVADDGAQTEVRDCYAVELNGAVAVTALSCVDGELTGGLRIELDPASVSHRMAVRAVSVPVASSESSLALLLLLKPSRIIDFPQLFLGSDLSGWDLSHLVVPPPDFEGRGSGSGVSVSVEVASWPDSARPGVLTVRPRSVDYSAVDCVVGRGSPIVASRGAESALVGVVTVPGSCDGRVPSQVSLMSWWSPWLAQAASCLESQQSIFLESMGVPVACRYGVLS